MNDLPDPQRLSDAELIRYIGLDPKATYRERVLVARLEAALGYVATAEYVLRENNCLQGNSPTIQ